MSFIYSFLSSKTRIVGFECSFGYKYCCFKSIVFTIIRLLSTIFYIDFSFTNNSLSTWSYRTRYNLCFLLLFKYYVATKLLCIGFETNLMQLCKSFNNIFALIMLLNNLFRLGIPLIHTFIIFPKTLPPRVVTLFDFLQLY
jgi:hypothetical protein